MATAAIIRDGQVENVIAVDHLADVQTPAWADYLDGASVLLVGSQKAAPGWSYDDTRSPKFQPPPEPEPEPELEEA